MAVINKKNAKMEFPLQIERQYAGPIESKEIWYSLAEAQQYAKTNPVAYAGQTIKVIDEAKHTVTTYTIQINGELQAIGSEIHTHKPADIIETAEKKFVSDTEKARWNDTYTKSETDKKLTDAITGLTFKGTFNTLADLPAKETAKDGWFAIVVNEPTAKGKNVLVIFESTTQEWKQLGDLLVPGVATESVDGLMGKEMVKALNKAGVDIAGLKDGSLLPKASATQIGAVKIGANINVAADGTISTHAPYSHPANHPATMITEDTAHRFVSDADKAVYADKFTKAETTTKISEAITASETKVTEAYKAADAAIDAKVTAMDTAYKAEDTAIRKEFAAADTALEDKITKAYTAEISTVNSAVSAMDTAYKAADVTINKRIDDIDTAYKAEDVKINKAISDMDTAYKAADTAINKTVTDMDVAYKAADTALGGRIDTLTQTQTADKTALEKQIKAVDAKLVAASDQQIDALFAPVV